MSKSSKIILVAFYLQTQTRASDNINTAVDKLINYSVNASAQPCQDFYSYACGNYNDQISLNNKNLLDYANHQYNLAIISLLEAYGTQIHQNGENCYTLTKKVRNYFEACRKVTHRNLTRYLEELKPGPDINWPIMENESSDRTKWPHDKEFDVFDLLGKLRTLGIANVIVKVHNISEMWKKTILIQPFESYNPRTLPYKKNILTLLQSMGIENPIQIAEGALETDKILLKLLEAKIETALSYIEISFVDLVKRYPNLNFKSYLREYMGKGLPLNASITLYNSPFFQELNDKMWFLFNKSKLCSYIMIKYLQLFDLNNISCIKELRRMFNLAVNYLYYHHNFDYQEKLVKPDVTEIFHNVIDMLGKHFQGHDLKLTLNQVESLRKKLTRIRLNIGNLPDNAACEDIEELYLSVPPLDENNYYKNHLLMIRFTESKLRKVHFETTSDLPAISYSSSQQIITLNYAYLMPPVYDFNYNNLGKYSLLGFILAQELVSVTNLLKLNNENKNAVSKPLQSVLECLKAQRENGDIALKHRFKDNVASEIIRKIVTLRFFNLQPIHLVASWKKHFLLNVAQHYCNTYNRDDILNDKQSDRLNRIAMNIEGFSQAFNCPESSKMNPADKCQIY